tara:strand:- start:91 stop:492 length:402 start_codon:yes stop_codon:yes gene_type:complete
MSGDTITGRAIQYTNDNKHAYAYSGPVTINDNETLLINDNTNSSYIKARIIPGYNVDTSENFTFIIRINNIVIHKMFFTSSTSYQNGEFVDIIIPPNVNFTIHAINAASTDRDASVVIVGKVGMAQRVGNLNE